MCGFVSYVHQSGKPISLSMLQNMTDIISHRGPDDQGIEVFSGTPFVSLGHKRLSIIDLSSAGRQPMQDKEGLFWIVFNGEIFNFKELRQELQGRGYLFKSNSDTEVLLCAYKEWGEKCLEKLNGMFAFAIWDSTKRELFGARDRLGIKPFYYYHQGNTLVLASEIKSILASGLVPAEPDWTALSTPWHYQISPATGFKGIQKIPAGHFLRFSGKGLDIKKYWDLIPQEQELNEREAEKKLSELLRDAVRLQMISDVPVGALLSGGLDSSFIVALMSRLTGTQVHTFTIRFDELDQRVEAQVDDSKYAKEVADLFQCEHQEITIRPDIISLLPKMIWHLDEPLADPAAINTYLISKAAKEVGVKVLLNGMGGDEIFGGYRKYLACLLSDQYNRFVPISARKMINKLAQNFSVADSERGFRYLRWCRHFANMTMRPSNIRFLAADMASIPPEQYSELFANGFSGARYHELPSVSTRAKIMNQNNISYLTRMCLDDVKHFLPDHNLTYSDKATMAAGVEGRPPLVDHRIVEFMFSLPPKYRINGWTQKYLLKKSAESLLPKRIIKRPKAPFGAPLRSWIRGDLKEMVDDILSPSSLKARGLFNPDTVRKLIDVDREGKADNALLIWSILTREMWFRTFIDHPLTQ